MRTLRLQSPRMVGIDVSSWQQFLVAQSVLGDIDGIYGTESAKGTRSYQIAQGLAADGIVGVGTFSRAVLNGFEAPAGRVAVPGIDADVDCGPFASAIASIGMKFVVRYYSQFKHKVIAPSEAVALSNFDLQIVVIYQDYNNNVKFFSEALGKADASSALHSADEIGQPAGSAIYFSADFDPDADQVRGPISDYFRAVSQAFAVAPARYAVGVYGSGLTCRVIRDSGLATFTWLSGSTKFQESSKFRPQASLVQALPERAICNGKLSIDDNVAQTQNFGAFQITA